MNIKSYIPTMLFVLLLVACVPTTKTPDIEQNEITTQSVTSIATNIPPQQTLSVPTPTTLYESAANEKCFEIADKAPLGKIGYGIAVFENFKIEEDGFGMKSSFLLDMETREIVNVKEAHEGFVDAFVSPDGTMLSAEYLKLEREGGHTKRLKDDLVIMTADGMIQKRLPWEVGWVSGAVWLDDQHVVINIAGLTPEESRAEKPNSLLVLNPFTGERQILTPDFPNMNMEYPLPWWGEPWGHSMSVYNKFLSHAVYLGDDGNTYILWDIKQKKEIMRFVHFNNTIDEQPRWSPDGTKFIASGYFGDMSRWPQPPDGLYLIDLSGNVSMLMSVKNNSLVRGHFWSPSGRYIALFMHVDQAEWPKRLMVLDTQALEVIDTCVVTQSSDDYDMPIWSPDETQILLYDQTNPEHAKVILVDLVKQIAFPIAEDMEPRGWMKSP